ncbi:MAG: hypothetical protein ACLGIA_07855 [Actinomycetes bacterium]
MSADDPTSVTFPFRFTRSYALAALPFGVTPMTTRLTLSRESLHVRFGPWQLTTPRSNIASTEIAGPYSFVKTAGPAHLSFSDHGVTFATNGDQGVCIVLTRPVHALNPFGPPLHPNLTVTVADPESLVQALAS